jgi:hypothetical protein
VVNSGPLPTQYSNADKKRLCLRRDAGRYVRLAHPYHAFGIDFLRGCNAKFSGHDVIFRSSETVLGDAPISASTSTRILSGNPPRATWSAAMLLGLYRMKARSNSLPFTPPNARLCRSSIRGHSEIMFGVLVVVLGRNPIARLEFSLG